ncbi:unnamed protein product [Acanthoscelides obtectus]|uniref:Ankyrin repeat and MYND domain-containing protein 1 n=1 Tax=Acanthoscelides obtectus TaxID=200917 RepID=A0A9P0PJ21_ACAOB|nr:unnamed protein product [Acanthoscelides obtectus]CAK1646042.1 Ankyrin repeat and MYND domain-containing protein 1 [Acanthoscelides obtectus]
MSFAHNLISSNDYEEYEEHEVLSLPIEKIEFPPNQRYTGCTLHDNLHGAGHYVFNRNEEVTFYDCLFYCNKIEGYGHIFYKDGSHFQGLFRENKRFGPGVFTYTNGQQDVGLWEGFSLIRLSEMVEPYLVPRLGTTILGKQKMFRNRHLVHVCHERMNRAKDIMINLGADKELVDKSDVLYSTQVKDRNNVFFNNYEYDEYFFPNNDCEIEVVEKPQTRDKHLSTHTLVRETDGKNNILLELHQKRIELLSNTINEVRPKLVQAREDLRAITEKIEFCRACCYVEEENTVQEDENNFSQRSLLTKASDDQGIDVWPLTTDTVLAVDTSVHDLSLLTFDTVDISMLSQSIVTQSRKSSTSVSSTKEYLDTLCCLCDEEFDVDNLAVLEAQQKDLQRDELFYRTLVENLEPKLQRHLDAVNMPPRNTKRVIVDKLLAWNNEEICKQMVKHGFIHRHSESMVNFLVSNVVGQERKGFNDSGPHEMNCRDFLKICTQGDSLEVIEYIRGKKVNVNVADACGNTAVFYATCCCRTSILKTLINFGANLDAVNDEGLTPLNLCLLHYLAWKYKIVDWEAAFVPPGPLSKEEEERYGVNYSTTSLAGGTRSKKKLLYSTANIATVSKMQVSKTPVQEYIFDLSCKPLTPPATIKARAPSEMKVGSKLDSKQSLFEAPDMHLSSELTNVEQLLEYGADPNVGEVPFSPLILASFTENDKLVKRLLEAKADVQVRTEDGLNCVHVAASLRCCSDNTLICEALLSGYADPNAKASIYHWEDQKMKILGIGVDTADIEDYGKNPLHLLCLRQDYDSDKCNYFVKVADLLVEANTNLHYKYLGHTPLSLAVLSGNGSLIEYFIASGSFNPHKLLDYDMGNVLTLYTLKKYEGILPLAKCKQIIHLLCQLYVSPLKPVGQFENAVAFGEFQLRPPRKPADEETAGTKKKAPKKSRPPKINKKSQNYIIIQYLKESTRKMIISAAQLQAVEYLYDLTEENLLEEERVKDLVIYLTPEITVDCLQILFNYGKLIQDRYSYDNILKLLGYVDKYKIMTKKKKGQQETRRNPKKGKNADNQVPVDTTTNFVSLLKHVDFRYKTKYSKIKQKYPPPGLDDLALYDVCFQCISKKDKELARCPKCRYVQFCSLPCYKQSAKEKNHTCGVDMFGLTLIQSQDELETLCKSAHNNCLKRYIEEKQKEHEEKMRKELEDRQADIYGTRNLKHSRRSEASTVMMIDIHSLDERTKKSDHTFLSRLESKLTMLSNLEKDSMYLPYRIRDPVATNETFSKNNLDQVLNNTGIVSLMQY